MATLEQILDEARKLPPNEQRRLLDALAELASNGNERPSYQTHEEERAWIEVHRKEFLDQWVALDGGRLISHGADAKKVYDEAREQGINSPYLVRVSQKPEAFMGGWQ
jgi:Family of unknown function (DUF5678)